MFNWVCPRCGHEVPPSKTECPFCFPPAPEAPQPQPPAQQYQPPPPPPQYAPQAPPPQYAQQAPPPQYWQPQAPPPQYVPQAPPAPPQPYTQQAPPQYWQPQPPPYQPQQYPPQSQYQPPPPQYQQPPEPQQYQPPPPPPPQPQEPPPPPPQQYVQAAPPPPPPPPQYTPPPAAIARLPEHAPTPWPPPEEDAGKPAWLIATLTIVGFLVLFAIAYNLMGSHSTSSKDPAKQQITNPTQKYIEVVGIRIVSDKSGQAVKFLVISHSGVEIPDLAANVTLWASTQRSEEDAVGTFTFHVDSLGPNESKELTVPLKTEKQASDMPEDWRNITADVQVTSPAQ